MHALTITRPEPGAYWFRVPPQDGYSLAVITHEQLESGEVKIYADIIGYDKPIDLTYGTYWEFVGPIPPPQCTQ